MPYTPEQIQAALNGPVQPDPSMFVDRTSPRHGMKVSVPQNLPDVAVDNEVSFQSGMPSDYMYGSARFNGDNDFLDGFGLTGGVGSPMDFAKGAAKSFGELTTGFLGQTLVQLGESVGEGEGFMDAVNAAMEGDVLNLFVSALNPIEYVSTTLENVGMATGTQDRIASKLQSIGRSLIDRNDAWIARHGLALTENGEPTLLHALGSGTTSLAGALGLAFVTKSPTATAVLFGQIQNSDTYMQAREQGLNINDAQFYASISGVVEAALEKFGLDIIMRSTGKGFWKNAAKGVLTEGMQEGMQTGASLAIAEMGDFSTMTREQKVESIKQSILIGAILGGGAGGVAGGRLPYEDALTKHINETTIGELSLDMDVSSGKPTIKLTGQMSEDDKKVVEQLQAFMDGVDLAEIFETRDQMDRAFQLALKSMQDGRVSAGKEIIAGKSRLLSESRSKILEQLKQLSQQGEDFVVAFTEKFKEKGYSEETIGEIEAVLELIAEVERNTQADIDAGRPFDEVFAEKRAQLAELEELMDEAQFEAFQDEMREDQEFQELLETAPGYIRMAGRAAKLREQLVGIDQQLDEIKALDPESEIYEATGKQLKMRDNVFKKMADISERVLFLGVKSGQKFTKDQTQILQKAFKDAVDSLPINDKTKARFMRRLVRVGDNPQRFLREIEKLTVDAVIAVDRDFKKQAKIKVKKLLRRGVTMSGDKSKLHPDIQDALKVMRGLHKNNARNFQANQSNDSLIDTMEEMNARYANLVADDSASTLDWQVFAEDLGSIIESGKTAWQARNESIAAAKMKQEAKVKAAVEKPGNRVVSVLNKATGAMNMNHLVWTFDTLIDMAGLHNTVFGQWMQADKKERVGRKMQQDRIKAIIAETMPRGYDSNNKKITITSGTNQTEEFTYGEAIQMYMWSRDPEVLDAMMDPAGMAYTEQNLADIESFIGSQGLALADKLFAFYKDAGERINEQYRQAYGTSLNLREFYSPLLRENDKGEDVMTLGPDSISMFIHPSSFKARRNNRNRIIKKDAISNAFRYTQATEWWLAYNQVYKDSKQLLKDPDIIEAMEKKMGKRNVAALKEHVDSMKSHSGEWNIMSGTGIDFFRRNFVRSTLGANPQIGIKQLSSMLATLSTVPVADYAKAQAEFWNPVTMRKVMKKLSEHESFRGRGRHFDPEIIRMLNENSKKWFGSRAMAGFIDFSLLPVRVGDSLAFGSSVYAEYKYLKKIGVPEEQALDRAMDNGERSQQSSLPSQMNLMQKEGNPLVRLVSMFTTSPIALMNMEMKAVQAWRDGRIDKRDMIRRIAVYHSFIPMFFGFVATAFDTEPEEVAYNAMFGAWGSTPLWGTSLSFMGSMITGSDVYLKKGLGSDVIFEATKENADLLGMAWSDFIKNDDSFTMEEYYEAISTAAMVDTEMTLGLPASNTVDMLEGVKGLVGEENKWDFFLKSIGFSDYVIEQDSGGSSARFIP